MPFFDVLIYGATMPGIVAGARLARLGYSVGILEWTPFAGGLTTGGLGIPDYVNRTQNWGITHEYFQAVEAAAKASGATEATYGRHSTSGLIRRFTPGWARTARDALLATPGLTLITDIELQEVTKDAVTKQLSAVTANGVTYTFRAWADASYEGDLLRMAGVTMTFGREGRASYDEFAAGYQPQWSRFRSTSFTTARGDRFRYATPVPTGMRGQADYKTQAYSFRMTLSTEPNRRTFEPPPGYKAADFVDFVHQANVSRWYTIKNLSSYQSPTSFLHSTNGGDVRALAWEYPRLYSKVDRLRFQERMFYIVAGRYYSAMTGSASPAALRGSIAKHGLPAHENSSEFIGTPGWSSAIYMRIVNRMIGQYVLSWKDATVPYNSSKPDPICLGGYPIDRHAIHFFAAMDGGHYREGAPQDPGRKIYQVPFRAVKPHPSQVTNGLAIVPVSMTDIIACSYRMEPTWMVTGDACGIALALALEQNIPIANLAYGALRERLVDAGARITP